MRILNGATTLAVAALLAACGGDGIVVGTVAGSLRVRIATTGSDLDSDGYDLVVDGAVVNRVSIAGTVTLRDLAPGPHTVSLQHVAVNCEPLGGPSVSVTLGPSDEEVRLEVQCHGTGIEITTLTTGLDPDPDGYTVSVGGGSPQFVAANGITMLSRMQPGVYSVALGGIRSNCSATSEQVVQVTVTNRALTPVLFNLQCVAATGSVRVTVAVSGVDLDLSGYRVQSATAGPVRFPRQGGTAVLDGIPGGPQAVWIDEVADNCSVPLGDQRIVQVAVGGQRRDTVPVSFEITCAKGERIAFTRSPLGAPYWGYQPFIAIAQPDGSGAVLLTEGYAGSWSPDGTRIVYTRLTGGYCYYYPCTPQGLYVIDSEGSGASLQQLTDGPGDAGAAWSPDGRTIAFARHSALHTMNADGTVVRAIPTIPGNYAIGPKWSPDGTRLAFSCAVDGLNLDVCLVNPNGSGFVRLTTDPGVDGMPAWSPDGSKIAFATSRFSAQSLDIAVMDADGQNVRRVTIGSDPAWSKDGTRILFSAVVQVGLYAINLDGTGLVRLTHEIDNGVSVRP